MAEIDSYHNPTNISTLIVGLIIAIVLIGSVLLPFLYENYQYHAADVQLDVGDQWVYTPATNLESTITIHGSAAEYATLENGTITLDLPDGLYSLTIRAESEIPYQYAEQTVTFAVGNVDVSLSGLMFTVPALLLVGMIVYVLHRFGISTGSKDEYDYDNY